MLACLPAHLAARPRVCQDLNEAFRDLAALTVKQGEPLSAMEEPPADEEPPLDGDEEELGDEGEEEAADDENEDANADPSGGAAGGGKRRLRRRLRADELNLLKAPMDVIVELTEATLEELADNRKLHQLRYPTYLVFTHPNFQLRATDGLRAIKGTALKARAAARAARAAPPPRRRRDPPPRSAARSSTCRATS